jgi:hypothetical protein
VWTQNGVIDNSRTTGVLNFSSLVNGNEGVWVCEMTNSCGTTSGPSVEIEVTTNTSTITQIGSELHATASDEYQWIDCDNGYSWVIGEINQVFAPASNGNYAVITSIDNCSDTSECYSLTNLGIGSSAQAMDIVLLPNPASDEIQLLTDESFLIESVKVMNTTGQIIIQGNSNLLKIDGLVSGTYFVTVQTSLGNWNGKFLKIAR